MFKKNARNLPVVNESSEERKDVADKQITALSVEREDDEQRKAFERMVDYACEILNNFKVPKRKRHSLVWLVVAVLVVAVVGWFVFSPADDEPKPTEQTAAAEESVVWDMSGTDIFALAKQADIDAGYNRLLVWYKYHVLQGAYDDVQDALQEYQKAEQAYTAVSQSISVKQDSLAYYQTRCMEMQQKLNSLLSTGVSGGNTGEYQRQRDVLEQEQAFCMARKNFYQQLRSQKNNIAYDFAKKREQWQIAEEELSEYKEKTMLEWRKEFVRKLPMYFFFLGILSFILQFILMMFSVEYGKCKIVERCFTVATIACLVLSFSSVFLLNTV